MFDKRAKKALQRTVSKIENRGSGNRRKDKRSYSEKEVGEIVEAHTILGCRFGIYLLYQVLNQKALKDRICEIGIEKLGMKEEELKDDFSIMQMLNNPENVETIGKNLHDLVLDGFITDEHASHAQGILVEHAKKDVEELMCAVKIFSEQLDDYYEKNHSGHIHSGISPTIN